MSHTIGLKIVHKPLLRQNVEENVLYGKWRNAMAIALRIVIGAGIPEGTYRNSLLINVALFRCNERYIRVPEECHPITFKHGV